VKGYLLDTNHVTAWEKQAPTFMAKVNALTSDQDLPRVSAITIGEVEAGHAVNPTTDQARRDEFEAFVRVKLHPTALDVTIRTRVKYAQVIKRLFDKHPKAPKERTEMYLVTQGIDINDVWIVAVAWEHNLTLLTTDKMEKIRAAVPEVQFDNWWPELTASSSPTAP
jgi:predicted nucleic acid-binding protein